MGDVGGYFGAIFFIHFIVGLKVGVILLCVSSLRWQQINLYSSLPDSLPLPDAVWISEKLMFLAVSSSCVEAFISPLAPVLVRSRRLT